MGTCPLKIANMTHTRDSIKMHSFNFLGHYKHRTEIAVDLSMFTCVCVCVTEREREREPHVK